MAEEHTTGTTPDLSALLGTLMQNPAALSMLTSLLSGALNNKGGHPQDASCMGECPKAPPLLPPSSPPPHKSQDNRACLLNALRPYLSPSRCDTVDSLLRILELLELLRNRR